MKYIDGPVKQGERTLALRAQKDKDGVMLYFVEVKQ